MNILQVTCILAAITVIAVCQPLIAKRLIAPPPAAAETEAAGALPSAPASAEIKVASMAETIVPAVTEARRVSSVPVVIPLAALSPRELAYENDQQLGIAARGEVKVAALEKSDFSMRDTPLRDGGNAVRDPAADSGPAQNLTYVAYYVYSELPPEKRPADIVLDSLKGVPQGTVIEEIKRAADAFGLDFNFMKAVAKISPISTRRIAPARISACSSLASRNSTNTARARSPMPATMRSRPPTSSSTRRRCSSSTPTRTRPRATFI